MLHNSLCSVLFVSPFLRQPLLLHEAIALGRTSCSVVRRKIGYSLEDVNSPLTAVTATCDGSECPKVAPSTKYLATVLAAGDGAPSGATHKLETGTVPKGLYKIKLWGFNDITSDGTASSASTAVATFGERECWARMVAAWLLTLCMCG